MRVNDPFEHKCPYCGCDLYSHIMGKALQKAISRSDFPCPCCNKTLTWKDGLCKRRAKQLFIVLFVVIMLFILSTAIVGPQAMLTIVVLGILTTLCIAFLLCLFTSS